MPCETEHERSAVLLGDEASELPLGLVDGLLVLLPDVWVALPHGQKSPLKQMKRREK